MLLAKKEINDEKKKLMEGKKLSVGSLKRDPQGVFEMCKVFCL